MDDAENRPAWAGSGAQWNCASPEWLEKLGAMLREGKPLPISKPRD